MNRPLIFFFTDFGVSGPYLGQMEAAVLNIAPDARVINLLADAPVANPRSASYLLAGLLCGLPENAIVVSVVDPGVGSERAALLVRCGGRQLLGPDNGLLALCLRNDPKASVQRLYYDKAELSATFHGRDLFAPAAGRIFAGQAVKLAPVESSIVGADWPAALEEVVYIDHYGNAVTGMPGTYLADDQALVLDATLITHAETYSAVPVGSPFWYRNSSQMIELAVNQGRADVQLGLGVGSRLTIGR